MMRPTHKRSAIERNGLIAAYGGIMHSPQTIDIRLNGRPMIGI